MDACERHFGYPFGNPDLATGHCARFVVPWMNPECRKPSVETSRNGGSRNENCGRNFGKAILQIAEMD